MRAYRRDQSWILSGVSRRELYYIALRLRTWKAALFFRRYCNRVSELIEAPLVKGKDPERETSLAGRRPGPGGRANRGNQLAQFAICETGVNYCAQPDK